MITAFPTLFKKTSKGATQQWRIWAEDDNVYTEWGLVGQKLQVSAPERIEAKNVGRANSTTAEQQAVITAKQEWDKKLKKGYVQDEAKAGSVDASMIEGGIWPMLAHKYSDHANKIVWPAMAQRKYDGHRCIAIIDDAGKCTLWSRTRKPIHSMVHIVKALESLKLSGVTLDGELWRDGYHDKFELLSHYIRQSKPEAGCEIVQYHVYDCASDSPFYIRSQQVTAMLKNAPADIVAVETVTVTDEAHMRELFAQYLAENYEGLMLRNSNSLYVNKRSYDLLKVKERDDAEFEIVGVEEGAGKLAGHGILVCKTKAGSTFKVKVKGSHSGLVDYLEHPDRYVGKLLTVLYQGLTADGIPRFPVGLRLAATL